MSLEEQMPGEVETGTGPVILPRWPDSAEIRALFAQLPLLEGVPEMRIAPADCTCHFDWILTHRDRPEPFEAYTYLWAETQASGPGFGGFWGSFVWLTDLLFGEPAWGITAWGNIEGDFLWDMAPDGADGMICRLLKVFQQISGPKHTEPIYLEDTLAFRCGRRELLQTLGPLFEHLFKQAFDAETYTRTLDADPTLAMTVLAPEWPWGLLAELPEWVAGQRGDPPLSRWAFYLLLFETFQTAEAASRWCREDGLRADVLAGYWWMLFLHEVAQSVIRSCPDADAPAFRQSLGGFAEFSKEVDDWVIDRQIFWDGLRRFDTSYEDATARKVIASCWWWVARFRESLRLALPLKQDIWGRGLTQLYPGLAAEFKLKYRRNRVSTACFELTGA